MSKPLVIQESFVSSLDFYTASDDEENQSVASSSTSNLNNTLPITQNIPSTSNIKERNSAAVIRPSGSRVSKQAALIALTKNSTSSTNTTINTTSKLDSPSNSNIDLPSENESSQPSSKRNPIRKFISNKVPRAPALDFTTIRTSAPRYPNPPPRPDNKPNRIFDLEHAPVYHPSISEFAKPMEYIEMIALEAKEFGICKIVPPEGWRPPFALNTETFRFKTRLQRLNSMEASARASLNFLEQLYIFHRQQGSSGISIPTIANKPLDLWQLKREVIALGGYVEVTNDRKWTAVAKSLGYNIISSSTICSQLKTAYLKIVVPFEDFVKRVKLAGGTPPPDPTILKDDVPILQDKIIMTPTFITSNGSETLATPGPENVVGGKDVVSEITIEKVRTASDKLNEALNSEASKVPINNEAAGLLPPRGVKVDDDAPGESCEICTFDHDPDKIVLCDGCDKGYHLNCLSPPLSEVPVSQFFCDACLLMNGAEYGFEEGEDHSLHSFRRRADAFKSKWLNEHPLPTKGKGRELYPGQMEVDGNSVAGQIAVEDHFEREFWRLVESQNESVEVEYGADVNSTRDGGGLPNLEVHPEDPYSRDGWNLNNLPILAGSLLRYIKSDISGMTIPWIYVGMVFSTFAWHKEDHYTYSINYHHWGDTKTWYGIPGADDEKLEAAMKLAAPELFEQQPDLMFQLVTLMSPGRLKKHGVRVVACDQRPNEFIVTFPRAYHSGFNHGFNFNEAVNFALPDWLPTGLKCVNRYRDIKKNPVFSHDELLVTISEHEKSPRHSRWLLPNWKEMLDREMASREKLRKSLPTLIERVDHTSLEEEDYQCQSCRTLCYLSQVLTADRKETVCIDHISELSKPPALFRLRYSDEELRAMYLKVKSRSDKAGRGTGTYFGAPELESRATGRKRKPSAAALAAAAGDDEEEEDEELPRSQRPRVDKYDSENSEEGILDITAASKSKPQDPSIQSHPPSWSNNPSLSNQGHSTTQSPHHQQHQHQYQQQQRPNQPSNLAGKWWDASSSAPSIYPPQIGQGRPIPKPQQKNQPPPPPAAYTQVPWG